MNYSLGPPQAERCPLFGVTLQEAYRLLRGSPMGSQVARTAVLGTLTWLVLEVAAAAQQGQPDARDAALLEAEAILAASGMADPLLQPIIDTARASAPAREPQEGEPERRQVSIAWLLRQLRAHCLGGVGIERGDEEMTRAAGVLGVTSMLWVSPPQEGPETISATPQARA